MDELLRRVLVHRDLLEDDLTLGVELVEARREHHVAHHLDRGREVLVRHARVDDRVLARRRRVQLAAEPVEDLGDLLRVVALRALEEQVLDEVRDARPWRPSRRVSPRRSRTRARPSERTVPARISPARLSRARKERISARPGIVASRQVGYSAARRTPGHSARFGVLRHPYPRLPRSDPPVQSCPDAFPSFEGHRSVREDDHCHTSRKRVWGRARYARRTHHDD